MKFVRFAIIGYFCASFGVSGFFFDSHRVNVMIIYCRTYGIPVDDKRGTVECFSIFGITFSCFWQ